MIENELNKLRTTLHGGDSQEDKNRIDSVGSDSPIEKKYIKTNAIASKADSDNQQ